MENFVIDLDKVLDEFEKSEDTKANERNHNQSFISRFYGDSLKVKLPENNYYQPPNQGHEKIDLADADFSASSSSLSSSAIPTTDNNIEDDASTRKSSGDDVSACERRHSTLDGLVVDEFPAVQVPLTSDLTEVEAPRDNLVAVLREEDTTRNAPGDVLRIEKKRTENEEETSRCFGCESLEELSDETGDSVVTEERDGEVLADIQKQPEEVVASLIGFSTATDDDLSNAEIDLYLRDVDDAKSEEENLETSSETASLSSEGKNETESDEVPSPALVSETVRSRNLSCSPPAYENVLEEVLRIEVPTDDTVPFGRDRLGSSDEVPSQSTVPEDVSTDALDEMEENSGDGTRLVRPTSLNLSSTTEPQEGSDTNSTIEAEDAERNLLSILEDGQAPVLSEEEQLLGKLRPFWIPDTDAPNCMHCEVKFNFLKRRHHCRACGKVLCGQCCNGKARLDYLENKESRVCCRCILVLDKARAVQRVWGGSSTDETPSEPGGSPQLGSPNPNNPQEYCSMVSPLQQVQNGQEPPTVMVPVGVLKRGGRPRGEPKQVMFSDGIRPGGDLSDPDTVAELPYKRPGRVQRRVEKGSPDYTLTDQPDSGHLMQWLQDDESPPVTFALTKNLHVLVKIRKLDCCVNRECWCFTSRGMCTVGQDEFLVVLERLPDEDTLPRDVFYVFSTVYDNASKGSTVSEMGHILFPEGLLGSREHSGFLFVRPTLQCVQQLHLPPAPYLVALLIQKWEIPWAKVFPLRLLLRIGSEFRYYPCPLVSVRFRKPVFGEIGHTIMSVLADFRNYHYTLPVVPGVQITMAERKTTLTFPRARYNQVVRIVTNSNEHVLGFGGNFSATADSHLVCVQTEDGNYQTQAINIQNTARKVTGASFIVFSGALKSSTGLTGKSSMVEDGLLIQIPNETMAALKGALQDMRDFDVACGQVAAAEPDEQVLLRWCDDDHSSNKGVKSVIDGRILEGVDSVRVHTGTDYASERHLIRWTEVFFLSAECANERRIDASKIAEAVAQACCLALTPHLEILVEAEMTKIGLRVAVDSEKVGYEIGACEEQLNGTCMSDLDTGLIPVITGISTTGAEGAILLELIFHVLLK